MELDQGIALQASLQACNQTGEIPHLQVFWKPLASEGGKASQGVMGQKKIFGICFDSFIHHMVIVPTSQLDHGRVLKYK